MGSNTITPPAGYTIEDEIKPPEGYELEKPAEWSDVPANAVKDVVGMGKGMADMGKRALDPTGLGEAISEGSIEPIKKAAHEPIDQAIGFAKNIAETVRHPIDTFKEHPVNTALNTAPLLGLFGESPVPKAAVAEDIALPKPQVTEPPPINMPRSIPGQGAATAEEVLGGKPPLSPASPSEPNLISDIKGKIPKEILEPADAIKNYLQKEYGQASKKPGMANIASDYLKEHARNMNLKEMGAAPGQIRKIGVQRAHELADYAEENGLVGPKIGTQGREKLVAQRLNDAGGAVGAFRKMASDRGAVQNINDLTNQVRAQLDQKYLKPGMYSGQRGTYAKALEELKKTDGSASALSDKVTEMFKEAKNQNPLGKPAGPLADVARAVRTINHESISRALSPQEMALYENALEDYGALTQIHEFVKRRGSTEAGGRLGPGSGISRAAVQKFLDSFGYRAQARIASRLADWIKANPDALTRPKDIFRNYVDEAAEAVHEMGDAAQ